MRNDWVLMVEDAAGMMMLYGPFDSQERAKLYIGKAREEQPDIIIAGVVPLENPDS